VLLNEVPQNGQAAWQAKVSKAELQLEQRQYETEGRLFVALRTLKPLSPRQFLNLDQLAGMLQTTQQFITTKPAIKSVHVECDTIARPTSPAAPIKPITVAAARLICPCPP